MTFPVTTPDLARSRRYGWLPFLIIFMTIFAVGIGVILLQYVELRFLAASGHQLTLAAAEVTDKLDRLLFERYGDARMMARAFALRSSDRAYLASYLNWVKAAYAPMYVSLAVTNQQGIVIAATDSGMTGQDQSQSEWFRQAHAQRDVVVGDVARYDGEAGEETVAITAPILDAEETFLGVVTTRVSISVLEAVTTRTIRLLQQHEGFVGAVEYQMLDKRGDIFVDSTQHFTEKVNLKELGLPSVAQAQQGDPGYVEEEHRRRHVPVVTGYAVTKGYANLPGLRWTVLVRMDRDAILLPIRSSVFWRIGSGALLIWFPLLVLLLWSTGRLRAEYRQAQQESAWARAAEAALLQSQERNRAIVDTALDGVVTIDAAGVITDWNAQATAIFGWSREEVLGQLLAETVIPERDREAHQQGLREFLKTGVGPILNRRVEITALHREGREFPVELSVSPARIGEAYIFSAFIRDITERRKSERRLASQYAVTRVLSESMTLEEAVPRIIQAVGESLEWDYGVFWRFDKQAGALRCLSQWHAPTFKVDEFESSAWQQSFQSGEGLPGRVWASGEPYWVADVTVDPRFVRSSVAARAGLHGGFGLPVRIGGEIEGVIEFFSRYVREPDEELLKMVTDIGLKIGQFGERTKAVKALHQTEAQLRQSQKMEAVGRLAGGVAHDFNNLLTVIRGYSELVLSRLSAGDPSKRELEEVKKAADRAAGLTGQLLAFSRRQFVATKIVDLNALVANMDGMLRRLLGEDIIELCSELDPNLGAIKADPGQIEQVIMNLAVNARDAMPTGGRLTVATRNVSIGKGARREMMVLEEGEYVLLTVKDTGQGMDDETQSHIFEPFFTTKDKGKGTGLGLSTVYGIVKQSGGAIGVDSKVGRGTTFKIYFPRVDGAVETGAKAVVSGESVQGRETILLVEDEPAVRGLVHETLRLQGYTVLEARHGIEALLAGTKHLGTIHLLLTDVVMPQMSGPEVAEKLLMVRPDMKVLYMSGYPDHPVFSQGGIKRDTAFLQKPFTPTALAEKVREVLDGAGVARSA
ncbi:MAG TPA: PAS domain S-box protein [Nitrospira sp.]|nr:PAS domain S-box protein [Nitrospira sp.]